MWFIFEVQNVERGEKDLLLSKSLYWWLLRASSLIALTHTHTQTQIHTHTWQGATSWLDGWLTLACLWLSVLPSRWDCCSLLLTLVVWNNPVAHLQAHLSASYSLTSLTTNNYVCVCMSLCVWVCISVDLTSQEVSSRSFESASISFPSNLIINYRLSLADRSPNSV